MTLRLQRIVQSELFNSITMGVILFNAFLLGLQTYPGLEQRHGDLLSTLDHLCLAYFVVELLIRIGSFGDKPWQFFKSGWNIFDFVVVVAVFLPGVRENITLLRLARLGRVLRAVRYLPQMRVIITAVVRSIPGTLSLAAVAGLVLYLYAMVGWVLFHDAFPEQYGTVGEALVSLFCLLTLDDLTNVVRAGYDYSPWTILYYGSFVLFAALVLLNILLGVVIRAMEEAHELEGRASQTPEEHGLTSKVDALVAAAQELRTEVLRTQQR